MTITPEIEAKWREEYAEWFFKKYQVKIEFDSNGVKAPPIGGRSQGRTVSLVAAVGWESWLAARSTVEIELPKPQIEYDGFDEPSYYYRPGAIKACIKSHGYRVKGEM